MKINGLGTFVFKNEKSIEGELNFNWNSKNFHQKPKLLINAVSKDRYLIQQLKHLPFFPWDLKSETADNREITAKGLALKTRVEKINKGIDEVSLGFNCNLVQIDNKDDECDHIDFYFPNLFIAFNEFEKV